MRYVSNAWLNTNKYLLIIFCCLLITITIVGSREVMYQLPRIKYYLNIPNPPSNQEAAMLKLLGSPTISQNEYGKLFFYAQKHAKPADYIEIGKCSPNPRLVVVQRYDDLVISNSDSRHHIISFSKENRFDIPARQSRAIITDFFDSVPGLYTYGCSGQKDAVGIVFVIP